MALAPFVLGVEHSSVVLGSYLVEVRTELEAVGSDVGRCLERSQNFACLRKDLEEAEVAANPLRIQLAGWLVLVLEHSGSWHLPVVQTEVAHCRGLRHGRVGGAGTAAAIVTLAQMHMHLVLGHRCLLQKKGAYLGRDWILVSCSLVEELAL